MKPCEFSETQYSFCFTFEYLKRYYPVIPLPVFPNTVQEGRIGGGYDVGIKGNIFFQFKIPKYYDKRSNFIGSKWKKFKGPFHSIKLSTDSDQFLLLNALKKPTNQVYYCTPNFFEWNELRRHYQLYRIYENSSLFPIENFPRAVSGHHNLIYTPTSSYGVLFSEPVNVEKKPSIHPAELFNQLSEETIISEARNIWRIIREYSKQLIDIDEFSIQPSDFVKYVHSTLITQFNIHWYPVLP